VKGKILVAGIGNIFLGDDAFGVEVARRFAERPLPEGVTVVDFGIRSYDLAYALMEDWELVILIDALPRGGQPGTLYLLEPELDGKDESPISIDAHTMNPVSVLQMVRALGGKPGRMLVAGCEPESIEPQSEGLIGLSAAVSATVDEAVRMIEDVINRARSEATAA
jgi:hydrogenase maturation protease